jgi:hypothetical protein
MKRVVSRVARAMATATKRAMVTGTTQAMAMAKRVVGARRQQQ